VRKQNIDTVLTVRTQRAPGRLAAIAAEVAAEGSLIGDIRTLALGEDITVREITVETDDPEQLARVVARLRVLPGVEVLRLADPVFDAHRGGKIGTEVRIPLETVADLRIAYTPGVARVATAIARDPSLAWDHTWLPGAIGIFTNGTRVLGLGDIGPVASLPVMEGKAALYRKLVGLSAVPILVDTKDVADFVHTVERVSSSFVGIHLEDIRVPDCFDIEDQLIERLRRPVMHDDQHGTATVALAALLNAARLTGAHLRDLRVGQIGLGAAGSAIARLINHYGVRETLAFDPNPAAYARVRPEGIVEASLDDILARCDVVIATTGRPGLIRPDQVRPGQVIFALSNPAPEIAPSDALKAGAAYAADGRSINNALAFPGLFAGAIAARSARISFGMRLAAAEEIARQTGPGMVVPAPLEPSVHVAVTAAVTAAAKAEGLEGTLVLA
jgi:malate dehydrogenase (oxaloacetate-decarboxylating)